MPVKKAILPPGMQKALICLLPIRLTSHFHFAARGFHWAANGMMRWAMARRRCSCGLPSPASAPLALACAISWAYCCTPACSMLFGRHQVARHRGLADLDLRERRRGRGARPPRAGRHGGPARVRIGDAQRKHMRE